MDILFDIEQERNYLISTRRHLHQNPELSSKEFKTAKFIEEQLKSFGIRSRRVGETGVLGTIIGNQGEGKTILLRADIDALPIKEETDITYRSQNDGVMHSCGHDAHTAALLGAAKVLQGLRDNFAGKILLVFQQAEEFGHGSKFFLAESVTKGVDRAFGVHIMPNFPVGTVALARGADSASCDYFKITVQGKGAHISKPHLGIDTLQISSLIVLELGSLVRRLVDPFETALIGIGKLSAGTTYNIIAETSILEGTIRTFSHETQALLQKEIETVANRIAENYGGSASVEFETFASPLINDDTAYDEIYSIATKIVGEENIITDTMLIRGLGADDFSEFIRDVKGVYARVGTGNKNVPVTNNPLHSSKLDIDENSLLTSARLHIEYALSILKMH